MLSKLKERNIFDVISGIIFEKPQDEVFYEEYKKIPIETIDNKKFPIAYNINFGHATLRCILPIGIRVRVNIEKQEILFLESPFAN